MCRQTAVSIFGQEQIQKCKMVCEEDLFSGNWKLTMHDEKGNPVLFANEGAEEGISLSVLH